MPAVGMPDPFHCIPDREFDDAISAFEFLLAADPVEYEGVLVDLDGVLLEVDGNHSAPVVGENVEEGIVDLLQDIAAKFGAVIVTNRVRHTNFDPAQIEAVFGVPVISGTPPKPSQEIFHAGVRKLGVDFEDRAQVVMVGDSPYQDTYGAKRAGLTTFQVDQDRRKYNFWQMSGKLLADAVQTVIKQIHHGRRAIHRS
jgi:ribonucleotide monophosphatase NagD (HAD superfamily)